MTDRLDTRSTVAVLALFVGLFAACQGEPQPPPLPPYRPNTTCAQACAHRAELGCEDAKPTVKKGTPCEAICEDVNRSGLAKWPTNCLVVTRTCDEGKRCTTAE